MLVHDTHIRTCALPVHNDCRVSVRVERLGLAVWDFSLTHSHCMLIQLPSIQLRFEFLT